MTKRSLLIPMGLLVVIACGTETAATTTSVESTTTTQAPTTTVTLPGEPIDFGPGRGDVLMVIGVAHDDVLNLRSAPGADHAIQGTIHPTFMELVAQGSTRQLSESLWIEVDHQGSVGWVNLRFVGYAGTVDDRTAAVVSGLDGMTTAVTMASLGEKVAVLFGTEESDIVQVTPVTEGDLTEVSFDVIGLQDDAVLGVRVHVFAEPSEDGFTLRTVEVLTICGRGVDDGACV